MSALPALHTAGVVAPANVQKTTPAFQAATAWAQTTPWLAWVSGKGNSGAYRNGHTTWHGGAAQPALELPWSQTTCTWQEGPQ
jgi:hypothetical protein